VSLKFKEPSLVSAGKVTQNILVGILYIPNGFTRNEQVLYNYFSLRYL